LWKQKEETKIESFFLARPQLNVVKMRVLEKRGMDFHV